MIEKIQNYCFLSLLSLLMPVFLIESKTVVATIKVGDTPAGIAITLDNRFAFVANNNNDGIPGGDTVSVIDLTNNTVAKTITDPSFNEPYTVTINADGTRAYITNSNSTTITIIDIATLSVIGIISGFDGPSGMVITPDGNRAYVNNYGGPSGVGSGFGTTVRVVDLNTNTIIGAPIIVGLAPAALAITPDGAFVYVINYTNGNLGSGTVGVIQTSTNKLVNTITGFSGPFGIAITPNGKYAYVTNFGSNNFSPTGTTVSVIQLSSNEVIATIKVGQQPSGITFTPDGRLAYVTNYNTIYLVAGFNNLTPGIGTVNIIDVCTHRVIRRIITVGSSPDAIAISSDGARAYVTNYSSNNVSVLQILERMWLKKEVCN